MRFCGEANDRYSYDHIGNYKFEKLFAANRPADRDIMLFMKVVSARYDCTGRFHTINVTGTPHVGCYYNTKSLWIDIVAIDTMQSVIFEWLRGKQTKTLLQI